MIGKANQVKTKVVYSHYQYENGNYKISERKWVSIDEALNKVIAELGEAMVIDIKFTSVPFGDGDLHESALIIYWESAG